MTDANQVGEVRRVATALANAQSLSPSAIGAVAILATELASNLHKHARDGQMVLRVLDDRGVELLAIDRGPGMADVAACLRDGYSTSGTPGTGLGAVQRQATQFDLYSLVGGGTIVAARVTSPPDQLKKKQFDVGAVCLPVPTEVECGDAWAISHETERSLVLVADGLGHGPLAASAAEDAVRLFRANLHRQPTEIMNAIHAGTRSTRGLAAAIAMVTHADRKVRFVGVGNIAGRILVGNAKPQSLVSHSGIVGHQMHKVQEFTYTWPEGAALILNSDGLLSQWALEPYPGLLTRHPSLIAGVLYRDFTRGRDDVTAVVLKEGDQ